MPKITTFLTFDNRAEEAAKYYVSIFRNSRIRKVSRYGDGAPMPKGAAMVVDFTLLGQDYIALNGGPHFKFTDAISLAISCKTQREVDAYWKKLSDGGEVGPCGWVKDRFGVSWQVNPEILGKLLSDPDPARARRAMEAMLRMKKIVIADLKKAADGK